MLNVQPYKPPEQFHFLQKENSNKDNVKNPPSPREIPRSNSEEAKELVKRLQIKNDSNISSSLTSEQTIAVSRCTNAREGELNLTVIRYEDIAAGDPKALEQFRTALFEKGIVGIRTVPRYREGVERFIEKAREFSSLPKDMKQKYDPDRKAEEFLGFEIRKEESLLPDGTLRSYYALMPESPENKWPHESLETVFLLIGSLIFSTAKNFLEKIQLIQNSSGEFLDEVRAVGRMLHYKSDPLNTHPWCGDHPDHRFFTVFLPSCYFLDGKRMNEPEEAGLFVKTSTGGELKKMIFDDPDVMLFQATEYEVRRPTNHEIERFTMAVFVNAGMDATNHS